jgi:hypothetical protein
LPLYFDSNRAIRASFGTAGFPVRSSSRMIDTAPYPARKSGGVRKNRFVSDRTAVFSIEPAPVVAWRAGRIGCRPGADKAIIQTGA